MRARTFWIGTALLAGAALFYLERCMTLTEPAAPWRSQAQEPVQPEPRSAAGSLQLPAPLPVVPPSRPAVERTTPAVIEDARPAKPDTVIEQFAPVRDALERVFNAESSDGAWAMNAQRTAASALSATLPPQSAIGSVTCRASLCRIESTHGSEAQVKTFVNQLADPVSRPWNGAFYAGPLSHDPRSGAVTLVTYLAREGATMPAIPDPASEEPTP